MAYCGLHKAGHVLRVGNRSGILRAVINSGRFCGTKRPTGEMNNVLLDVGAEAIGATLRGYQKLKVQ